MVEAFADNISSMFRLLTTTLYLKTADRVDSFTLPLFIAQIFQSYRILCLFHRAKTSNS